MTRDDHRTPQALSELCRQAGAQAASARPYAARLDAAPAGRQRPRLLKAGLGASGLLALVVVAAEFRGEPAAAVAPLDGPVGSSPATRSMSPVAAGAYATDAVAPVRAMSPAVVTPPAEATPPAVDDAPMRPQTEEEQSQPGGSC